MWIRFLVTNKRRWKRDSIFPNETKTQTSTHYVEVSIQIEEVKYDLEMSLKTIHEYDRLLIQPKMDLGKLLENYLSRRMYYILTEQ